MNEFYPLAPLLDTPRYPMYLAPSPYLISSVQACPIFPGTRPRPLPCPNSEFVPIRQYNFPPKPRTVSPHELTLPLSRYSPTSRRPF